MESVLDNYRSRETLLKSMEEPPRLTPQELFRFAAGAQATSLPLAGRAGAKAAIRNFGEKHSSAPKKRRKMRAAWEVMIALTEKARRGKAERLALHSRRERGAWAHPGLTSIQAAAQPAPSYDGIAKLDP